ncbi:MAG: hypothetical protein SF123_10925 [Chloroflexota bacterium]|nr:hypothetical protein [Chloroflexota bacterium]
MDTIASLGTHGNAATAARAKRWLHHHGAFRLVPYGERVEEEKTLPKRQHIYELTGRIAIANDKCVLEIHPYLYLSTEYMALPLVIGGCEVVSGDVFNGENFTIENFNGDNRSISITRLSNGTLSITTEKEESTKPKNPMPDLGSKSGKKPAKQKPQSQPQQPEPSVVSEPDDLLDLFEVVRKVLRLGSDVPDKRVWQYVHMLKGTVKKPGAYFDCQLHPDRAMSALEMRAFGLWMSETNSDLKPLRKPESVNDYVSQFRASTQHAAYVQRAAAHMRADTFEVEESFVASADAEEDAIDYTQEINDILKEVSAGLGSTGVKAK